MFLDFRFLFFQKPKREISLFLSHYGHPAAAAAVNLKQIYLLDHLIDLVHLRIFYLHRQYVKLQVGLRYSLMKQFRFKIYF